MLRSVIEANTTFYDATQIGRILADSDADLADEESCVEAMIAHGIRPWMLGGEFTLGHARAEAHNIRTSRRWMAEVAKQIRSDLPVVLLSFVLGSAVLASLASAAMAAEHDTSPIADPISLFALAAAGIAIVVGLAILFTPGKE